MTILPFHSLTPAQVAQTLAIYRSAFKYPWEWPVEKVAQLADPAAPDESWHGVALANGDPASVMDVAAIAVAKYFAETNLWYLLYLAVDPMRRGQGHGSTLLAHMLQMGEDQARAAGRPGCRGMLLEVETPDGPPEATRDLRRRRVAFYRRFGVLDTGVIVPRPSWIPSDQPDWDIMFIPGAAWEDELDIEARREFCRALLVEGYGKPADAPWLLAYLAGIA